MNGPHHIRFKKCTFLVGYQGGFAAICAGSHLGKHQLRSQLDSDMPEIAIEGVFEDCLQRLIDRAMISPLARVGLQKTAAVPRYGKLLARVGPTSSITEVDTIQKVA